MKFRRESKEMKWIDMHCDTLSAIAKMKQGNEGPGEDLYSNSLCVDLNRLNREKCAVQFFACYVNVREYARDRAYDEAYSAATGMIDYAHRMAGADRGFRIIEKQSGIQAAVQSGGTAGILTVEDAGVLDGQLSRLDELYRKGVRLMTLTWNYENCIGWPNSCDPEVMGKGLKEFGVQVLERMNSLGMIIDVSHLSDGGFWDCIRLSKYPVAASHSNARKLCPHRRNLTDEMLRALGDKGGVAGLNFYGCFLRSGGAASVWDIAEHAAYMIGKAGEDTVALGTDFDGFDSGDLPAGVRGTQDMERVWHALKKRGITERQIEKLAYGNVMRVLREVWK